MRTVSEKYANSTKEYMDDTDLVFDRNDYRADRFQIIARYCSIVNNRKKYSAKWERSLSMNLYL